MSNTVSIFINQIESEVRLNKLEVWIFSLYQREFYDIIYVSRVRKITKELIIKDRNIFIYNFVVI